MLNRTCDSCHKRPATIASNILFEFTPIYLCVLCFRELYNAHAPKEELQKVIADSKTPTDLVRRLVERNSR